MAHHSYLTSCYYWTYILYSTFQVFCSFLCVVDLFYFNWIVNSLKPLLPSISVKVYYCGEHIINSHWIQSALCIIYGSCINGINGPWPRKESIFLNVILLLTCTMWLGLWRLCLYWTCTDFFCHYYLNDTVYKSFT